MAEYIEREAAKYVLRERYRIRIHFHDMESATQLKCAELEIGDIPAADVRPVKRGKWIGYPECLKFTNAYSDDHIVCSVCGECFSILDNDCERFNYCPNCGAKMEES